MDNNKTFIGFDLGDGESITDFVTMDASEVRGPIRTTFIPMTMPGYNEPGRAIPTTFGYDEKRRVVFAKNIVLMPDLIQSVHANFKRRPSDLIPGLTQKRGVELLEQFGREEGWPKAPDCNTPAMLEFRDAVITFTNAVFENPAYLEKVKSEAADSSEIVFSVGHPTRWDDLDVAIYQSILQGSILGRGEYAGKKSSLNLAAESRAAYLAVKDKTTKAVLPQGTSALLIDVGSSTIDLTVVSADSHNYQYNSGSNYLGARGIDFLIQEMYLEKLNAKSPDDFILFQKLIVRNPSFIKSVTLACRLAKEDMYSSDAGMGRITLGDFSPIRILQEEVDQAADTRPVASVLARNIQLPEEQRRAMGDQSWTQLFRTFLTEQKSAIAGRKIKVGRIILTGSASKMPFVGRIVREVFHELPEGGILADMNPSRSISMGLALVGPSNEKSLAFQRDLNKLLDEQLPTIIEQDLPKLADELSGIICGIVRDVVKRRMNEWRSGRIKTLQRMTELIQSDCEGEKLEKLISGSDDYNAAISAWMTDVVGADIAVKLKEICIRYGVKDLTLENLNVMKAPEVSVGSINVDVLDFMDAVITLVSIIAGIIAAIILPTVLGVVIGIIAWISVGIASFLLGILLAIPGAGWAILLGLAGIAVVNAASKGLKGAKEDLTKKLQTADLPQWIRDRMTNKKIDEELSKADMEAKIRAAILEEESKNEIISSVSTSLRAQVEKRAEDIKYVIESK